jgi:hypothetical protein
VLELPKELGPVQKAFNIAEEGSFIISVKNPDVLSKKSTGESAGLQEKQKATLPTNLKQKFADKRWIAVNPPEFLDYDHAEILFIAASDDLIEEFGKTGEEIEAEEKKDARKVNRETLFKELRLKHKEIGPIEPLLKGRWK